MADIKQFAKKIIDCFVGTRIDDDVMEGNPWRWEVNEWIRHGNYDIARNFPTIRAWESKMSSVENKLCFRHIRNNESVENEKNNINNVNRQQFNHNVNNENDHPIPNDNDTNLIRPSHMSITSQILEKFPNTTHNILIIQQIREIKVSLNNILSQNDEHYKERRIYKNNKISLRFLIDQLSNPNNAFHEMLTILLYTIVVKNCDIMSQISDCNDGLRTVRETSSCYSHIQNLKINDPNFDLSQDSVPKNTSSSKPSRTND